MFKNLLIEQWSTWDGWGAKCLCNKADQEVFPWKSSSFDFCYETRFNILWESFQVRHLQLLALLHLSFLINQPPTPFKHFEFIHFPILQPLRRLDSHLLCFRLPPFVVLVLILYFSVICALFLQLANVVLITSYSFYQAVNPGLFDTLLISLAHQADSAIVEPIPQDCHLSSDA